jgi:hypothetical protein
MPVQVGIMLENQRFLVLLTVMSWMQSQEHLSYREAGAITSAECDALNRPTAEPCLL